MKLEQARKIAQKIVSELASYCERIEIAGSIRRCKPEVGDIEIVAIPKVATVPDGLFSTKEIRSPGFVMFVNQFEKVKGDAETGKYTQRILPEGIKLDLFTATKDNWGLIFAIRTGSAKFSKENLAFAWVRRGYKSVGGMMTRDGEEIAIPQEQDLFDLIGVSPKYRDPRRREL